MPTTDIYEKGLETLIMRHMTGNHRLVFAAPAPVELTEAEKADA